MENLKNHLVIFMDLTGFPRFDVVPLKSHTKWNYIVEVYYIQINGLNQITNKAGLAYIAFQPWM